MYKLLSIFAIALFCTGCVSSSPTSLKKNTTPKKKYSQAGCKMLQNGYLICAKIPR